MIVSKIEDLLAVPVCSDDGLPPCICPKYKCSLERGTCTEELWDFCSHIILAMNVFRQRIWSLWNVQLTVLLNHKWNEQQYNKNEAIVRSKLSHLVEEKGNKHCMFSWASGRQFCCLWVHLLCNTPPVSWAQWVFFQTVVAVHTLL